MDRRESYLFITFCNTLQCVKHGNENAVLLRLLVFGALMFQDIGLALDSITFRVRIRSVILRLWSRLHAGTDGVNSSTNWIFKFEAKR